MTSETKKAPMNLDWTVFLEFQATKNTCPKEMRKSSSMALGVHVKFGSERNKLSLPDFVVRDAETHAPRQSQTDKEFCLVLESWKCQHVAVINPGVIEVMEMTTDLDVRLQVSVHGLTPLLLLVALGVGVVTPRMQELHRHFLGQDNLVRVLPEVDDVVATFDVLAVVLEAARDERGRIHTRLQVGREVVVASDGVGRDALLTRILLDEVGRLRHSTEDLDVHVVTLVHVLAITEVAHMEDLGDSPTGKDVIRIPD